MLKNAVGSMAKLSTVFGVWLLVGSAAALATEVFEYPEPSAFSSEGGLAPGESKTVTVRANTPNNRTDIYVSYGMKYKFTVSSPEWNNGSKETTAAGYESASLRRHPDAKLMELVADVTNDRNATVYSGKYVRIGMGRSSWTAPISGWLFPFANDCLTCYSDNSRVVTLTIKRIE